MCPPEDDTQNVFSHKYYIYQSDRVSLHHKVVTKIKMEPSKQRKEIKTCHICAEQAIYFCENDQAYFCEEDWVAFHEGDGKINNANHFLSKHKRKLVSERQLDFGMCPQHPTRKNEYFNVVSSKPYCSQCVVDLHTSQNVKQDPQQLLPIQQAYQHAKDDAFKEDIQL
jgi:hypothetical protein